MVPQPGSVDKFQEEAVSCIKQRSTEEKTVQILGMQAPASGLKYNQQSLQVNMGEKNWVCSSSSDDLKEIIAGVCRAGLGKGREEEH